MPYPTIATRPDLPDGYEWGDCIDGNRYFPITKDDKAFAKLGGLSCLIAESASSLPNELRYVLAKAEREAALYAIWIKEGAQHENMA